MINLDAPSITTADSPISLFEVVSSEGLSSALKVGSGLLAGSDQVNTYKLYNRGELELQSRIIHDPAFDKPSVLWRRFGVSETVSLFELIGSAFGGVDIYFTELFVPEMLGHGRADNGDTTEPDSWQDYTVEDKEVFEAQVKLLGLNGSPPPVSRGSDLENFARAFLAEMEFPYEVDADSEEYKNWFDREAGRIASALSETVEGYDLDAAPAKE